MIRAVNMSVSPLGAQHRQARLARRSRPANRPSSSDASCGSSGCSWGCDLVSPTGKTKGVMLPYESPASPELRWLRKKQLGDLVLPIHTKATVSNYTSTTLHLPASSSKPGLCALGVLALPSPVQLKTLLLLGNPLRSPTLNVRFPSFPIPRTNSTWRPNTRRWVVARSPDDRPPW